MSARKLPLLSLIQNIVTWVALAAGLALPTVVPELANVLFLTAAALALVLCARGTDWADLIRRPGVLAPILAIAMLCVAFAITARTPLQALAAAYFAPMLLIAPLVALFERASLVITAGTVGLLAAVGAVGAAGVALYDSVILGQMRAGSLVNNPIHFASLALVLGFTALIGLSSARPIIRLLALFAPSLSLLAVLLSGSRGPLLAAVPMVGLAVVLILVRGFRRRVILAAAGLAALLIIGLLVGWLTGVFQRLAVFAELPDLLASGTTRDSSTIERIHIYLAAWRAFLASPIYGYGLTDLTGAVREYMQDGVILPNYQHLHNDLADFAVAGGVLGIVAYLLFLLAPVLEAMRVPQGSGRGNALYLALLISTSYSVMALTNAAFGILSQTTLYAFVTALIVYLCRQATATSQQTS